MLSGAWPELRAALAAADPEAGCNESSPLVLAPTKKDVGQGLGFGGFRV